MNKRIITGLTMLAGCLGMGMAMPSCPGQQAMQQQVDTLQTKNAEQTKAIQQLTTNVNTMKEEMTQVKTLVGQMGNTVLAQKAALEQLEQAVKDLAAKAAARPAPAKAAAKPAKGKPSAKSLPTKKKGH
ncbi:MAG: hypothetical protein H7222_07785 [Methylotenera sp.]|nr:hypothetical protein [Oligoflexia bacterium]